MKLRIFFCGLLVLSIFCAIAQTKQTNNKLAKEYHVSVTGNDTNEGSVGKPFRTINYAAQQAVAGDTITVHTGTYREWVNPKNGGSSDARRIVYRAAPGEKAAIKGSEIITGWKQVQKGIWKVSLPNSFFGAYNACNDLVYGDWCDNFSKVHTADLFINGKSLYETDSLEKVTKPVPFEKTRDKEGSLYTWHCKVNADSTTIFANFQSLNPNKALTELSIRKTVFYPEKTGINYLTIQGFDISQAATQWAAPTAEQIGMIATHWNKGWIIENNIIHDSKSSGITLGKEKGTGHNVWSNDPSYDGSLHYIEVTFRALRNGWNKENIGSHIVRNNTIYNCEQTGICGSFGAAFSTIQHNHIYNIHQKKQFTGAELAGIKLHAAIDVVLDNNRIHDVGAFGYWMDWMAQGTRLTKNVLYRNDWQDMFFEVNHGPFLVDNNIMLSNQSIATQSEGGAFVHNLITGSMIIWSDPNRFTPYHLPHSTEIAGMATVAAGDDRYYNNIFLGKGADSVKYRGQKFGMLVYNKDSTSPKVKSHMNLSDHWPIWINHNVYYNEALPWSEEKEYVQKKQFNPDIQLMEEGDKVYLQFTTDESLSKLNTQQITTALLGKTKLPKAFYENPDGTALRIDTDFLGNKRATEHPSPGPFEIKQSGKQKIKVW
ncbi:right-handed parallel beta-helix repeat-containing protein [Chitinophagaceae bacterium LB-8]|uniref:Right-handed parallel beta-helix repeat-containing protein n=1 Tax=Paraflavisolibacter caeni TaxID=2982496 RepID=A0A9X2Y1C2_9BACT|nr:right-handed parallel beta-helix repeat-containing protein [Paraflavisolibacter caeni]MCU7552707.1 right-handed parallel beta-helix repeat-containing protein [Paraflavisolibacter caeni]